MNLSNVVVAIFIVATIVVSAALGQNEGRSLFPSSGVFRDTTKPGVIMCYEKPKDTSMVRVRITNNYIWTLQFPVENAGRHDVSAKLSNGREVAMLADGSTFFPYFWIESRSGKTITGRPGHLGSVDFLLPNRSVTADFQRQRVFGNRVFLDFNYEWELETSYLGSPTHRIFLLIDERFMVDNRCPS